MDKSHSRTNKLQKLMLRFEHWLDVSLTVLRVVFIALMIVYTAIATFSFAVNLGAVSFSHGALPYAQINQLFTDGLFILIVISIVRALFLHNSFDYVVTMLETGFVVMIRQLVVLSTYHSDDKLILILGGISALFFALIIVTHTFRRKWHFEDLDRKEHTQNQGDNTKKWYHKV